MAGLPPKCVIASCTTERVGGGGICRLDSECTGGALCHPTYRQCVRACTSVAQCRRREPCTGSFCTRGCTTAATALASFGPGAILQRGHLRHHLPVRQRRPGRDQRLRVRLEPRGGRRARALRHLPDRRPALRRSRLRPGRRRRFDARSSCGPSPPAARAPAPRRSAPSPQALDRLPAGVHTSILVAQGTYAEQVVLTNGVELLRRLLRRLRAARHHPLPHLHRGQRAHRAPSRAAPSTPRASPSARSSPASPFAATT